MKNIQTEKCPHCHEAGGLFVCSMGAVNCANCGTYVRPLTEDEWKQRQEALKKIMPTLTNRTPLAESLHTIRITAKITLREMANTLNLKASEVSDWEMGRKEPTVKEIEAFLKTCVKKSKIE